jgi:hypothetical protein
VEPWWHPEKINKKVEAERLTQPVALLLPANGPKTFSESISLHFAQLFQRS